jgi:hypothetical protein
MLLFGSLPDSRADFQVSKIGDSVVDAEALTIRGGFGQCINGLSFQQDAVVTHKDHQYVAYYDAARRVCLARRRLSDGDWQVIRFEDYAFKSNDAHNTISLGICPTDGTIHLAFDHHGHPLHYRVSQKGAAANPAGVTWEASLFGPIRSELEKGRPIAITYPRFWQTPRGGLQFCYRQGGSGNGDRMLVDYEPETGTWIDTRQIDSRAGVFDDHLGTSGSRCSYPNGYDYGPHGNLHVTWVWRESSQGANHDLMYSYSQDRGRTWRNNRGEPLPDPPGVRSPAVKVVDISRAHGLMNTHGQAVDSQGRIHVVMWHCTDQSLQTAGSKPGQHRWGPPEARRYHHYWRDDDAAWRHVELPQVAGNRPKLFMDQEDNAYLVYCDAWSREIFFLEGKLIIAAATADSRWTDWKIIHTEKGPFFNEMLGDAYRWKRQGVLSVMVQQSPEEVHEPTALRIIDFSLKGSESIR